MVTPSKAEPKEQAAPGLEPGYLARIRYALGADTPNAFAKRAGLTRSYLYAVLRAEKLPSLAFMSSVEYTAGVSLQWLVSGRGMPTPAWNEKTVLIPCLDVAPDASLQDGGKAMLVELDFLKGIPANKAAVLPAPNADMAPLIQRGDQLIVEMEPADILESGIYIVRRQNYLKLRKFIRGSDGIWLLTTEDPITTAKNQETFEVQNDEIVARIFSYTKVFI